MNLNTIFIITLVIVIVLSLTLLGIVAYQSTQLSEFDILFVCGALVFMVVAYFIDSQKQHGV